MLISLSLATGMALCPAASSACGYHDDVTMARGLLNWIYPDALHVLGAISAAVAEGQLPNPNLAASAPDMFGAKYHRTVQSLERLGYGLAATSDEARPDSISLVLIEPMLWSRFELSSGQLRTQTHVTGPKTGDLVLVSGEAVIGEIASGRLTIGKAHQLGLVRLYGPAAQQARFLLAYERIKGGPPAVRTAEQAGKRPHQTTAPAAAAPMTAIATSSTLRRGAPVKSDELGCGPGHH
jgi:hypothetical protein